MRKKTLFVFGIVIFLMIFVLFLSLMTGANKFSFDDLWALVNGQGTRAQRLLLMQFRLPRTLVAILAGMGLAASGFLLQGVTQNDLADSSILGINSGAGLFVLFYLGFFSDGSQPWLLPVFACLGSLLAGIVVYLFSQRRKLGISTARLLLAGIAINAGISALTLFLTVRISQDTYNFITSWLAGSIWGVSWQYVQLLSVALLLLLPLSLTQIRPLQTLSFGDEVAIGLGVNVKRHRQITLILAILLAGSSVSVAGSISFVGLVAPHIAKQLLRSTSKRAYLLGCLVGGLIVLVGDTIGKNMLATGEVPAGILVALIGAPYFVFLLMRRGL